MRLEGSVKNLNIMDKFRENSDYDGNGWTKYQNLVLDQLKEQKELLKGLMADIAEIKRQNAVHEALAINWRNGTDKAIEKIQETIEYIMEDEKGINSRVRSLEENLKSSEKVSSFARGLWATAGAVVVVLSNVIIEGIKFLISKP
jgi:hypothetical protein